MLHLLFCLTWWYISCLFGYYNFIFLPLSFHSLYTCLFLVLLCDAVFAFVIVMVLLMVCCGCVSVSVFAGPQSPGSPSTHNQHAPIPYDQLQHTSHSPVPTSASSSASGNPPTVPAKPSSGSKGLPHRPQHPLKSFTVPGPPGQSNPGTPNPNHGIGTNKETFTQFSPWSIYQFWCVACSH